MAFRIVNGKVQRFKNLNYKGARLLKTDKETLIEFSNKEGVYSGVVSFYIERLRETEAHAVNLIHTLQKQYKIDE